MGTAVKEAYFILFSMGAHLTGMTRYCLWFSHIETISSAYPSSDRMFPYVHDKLMWKTHRVNWPLIHMYLAGDNHPV